MTQNLLRKILCSFFFVLGGLLYSQTVTGTVSDASGTLPGVNVIVKGTSNGVQSDLDGTYSLDNVATDAVLVFSYLGYKTQEVAVDGRSTIDVTLEEDIAQLDAVVVVGYGNQVRKEITTAVTSVGEEEFNQGVINNASQLLQGKVAGLSIYNKGGNPNDNGVIRLRGLSTVGGNTEPLVVIDGVLGQSLNNVDPSDIKNITVLKDGSAAAIYGSRASSGVILVTTKSGRSNQPFSVEYNGQYGVSNAVNQVEIMNRSQFLATGGTDLGADTDWIDEVTRSAFSQVHNIAATGGSENSNYRVAVNYRDTEGILLNSGFEQLNIRGNFTGTLLMINLELTLILHLHKEKVILDLTKRYVMQLCIIQLLRY